MCSDTRWSWKRTGFRPKHFMISTFWTWMYLIDAIHTVIIRTPDGHKNNNAKMWARSYVNTVTTVDCYNTERYCQLVRLADSYSEVAGFRSRHRGCPSFYNCEFACFFSLKVGRSTNKKIYPWTAALEKENPIFILNLKMKILFYCVEYVMVFSIEIIVTT